MHSLERALLRRIVGTLAAGALLVTAVAYRVTLDEMNEVFDAELKTIAEGVASVYPAGPGPHADVRLPERRDRPQDVEIVTLMWTPDGRRLYSSDPRAALPFSAAAGLASPVVTGERWIVYTNVHAAGVAQAAQRHSARQEMAGESAAKISSLLVGLVAGVGVLLVYSLRRGLAPLDAAARDIAARSAGALEPIGVGGVPRELQPVLDSTNALLQRLAAAFTAQRRFLADAAHELRTPITALRLQLQLLQRSPDAAAQRAALAELQAGIDRSQHLVEQLLQVARSGPDGEATRRDPVDLGALARSVVGHFSIKADARGIDLGARAGGGIVARGDAQQLTVLLNNLVDNALRYTPPGGTVDVEAALEQGQPVLRVLDDGPGIDPAERGRVFDRFYRGAAGSGTAAAAGGSGLGLAIVRAIAERHGARVELADGPTGRGLAVSVRFAAAGGSARPA
ncbi:MAG: ATP-binding protein [Rubrivivax sp.]